MKAETFECKSLYENEKFYLSGKIEIKLNTSCLKLKIEDHKGNSKIYSLTENILLSSKKSIDFKSKFQKLKNNLSVKKLVIMNILLTKIYIFLKIHCLIKIKNFMSKMVKK